MNILSGLIHRRKHMSIPDRTHGQKKAVSNTETTHVQKEAISDPKDDS